MFFPPHVYAHSYLLISDQKFFLKAEVAYGDSHYKGTRNTGIFGNLVGYFMSSGLIILV